MDFNYLEITQENDIATLWLNNAKKANCRQVFFIARNIDIPPTKYSTDYTTY